MQDRKPLQDKGAADLTEKEKTKAADAAEAMQVENNDTPEDVLKASLSAMQKHVLISQFSRRKPESGKPSGKKKQTGKRRKTRRKRNEKLLTM